MAETVELRAEPPTKGIPFPALPIDGSNGECDDVQLHQSAKAWSRQHAAIAIDDAKDYVTHNNSREVYSMLKERGVSTVLVVGVHTNMFVVNRTFAIKQLRRWNVDCVLVRDHIESMCINKKSPFVTHHEGTELVLGHI